MNLYHYSVAQWILFFMIYCMIGWIWETCYVSIKIRQLTNRGFLNGPFLPIYGFGAIAILFAVLPVRHNLALVFLLGTMAATLLEYVTGYAMEQIFHARYWDYTNDFANVKGYICLKSSIAWGVASILLIKCIHAPFERLLLKGNETLEMVLSIVFCVYFVTDTVLSTREAFDLKKFIDEQVQHNETLKHLQKRMDVLVAFAEDDKEKLEARVEDKLAAIRQEIEEAKNSFETKKTQYGVRAMRILRRNPEAAARVRLPEFASLREVFDMLHHK